MLNNRLDYRKKKAKEPPKGSLAQSCIA